MRGTRRGEDAPFPILCVKGWRERTSVAGSVAGDVRGGRERSKIQFCNRVFGKVTARILFELRYTLGRS